MSTNSKPPPDIEAALALLAGEDYCYLTTTGRLTGRPHEIEIWFGVRGRSLYLLSGGGDRSDWVRNIAKQPQVRVRIRNSNFSATARQITDLEEETAAREMLASKYQGWRPGRKPSEWARTALPIAIDVQPDNT